MKTKIDWDFARGGRTLHAWDGQTVNSKAGRPVGVGDVEVTLCGVPAVKRWAHYIQATDPHCPKCSAIMRARLAQ